MLKYIKLEVDGERWHDPNNEKEIKRENIIKQNHELVRFKAKKILKKEYENEIKNIVNKILIEGDA